MKSRLEHLGALSARPWPMEPVALARLATEGPTASDPLEPPATGPRVASKVRGAVALIGLEGVVVPWKVEAFAGAVRAAAADPGVGALVLAIDSPGGVITGVPEAAETIYSLRGSKPITAVSTGLMASAAYWIGSAADTVVASPSAYAGSIGVWTMHADLSKLLDGMGIKVNLISAGKYKVEGNFFEPLSDEARASIQGDVDDAYDQFLAAVARHRADTPGNVRKGYGEGRVLNARRAKEAGLVDRIETLDTVVGKLAAPTTPRPAGRAAAGLRRRVELEERAS